MSETIIRQTANGAYLRKLQADGGDIRYQIERETGEKLDPEECSLLEALSLFGEEPTVDEIIAEAGTSAHDICVAQHQANYCWLAVKTECGAIVAAEWRTDIINSNETYIDAKWHKLYRTGCGSTPCNCDACQAGDEPAEWASDDGRASEVVEEIQIALKKLLQEINAQ